MAQSIEFVLHPPSPKLNPNNNKRIPLKIDTVLPSVSSLLQHSPNSSSLSASSSNQSNELPILLSPSLSSASSSHSSSIYQHSPILEPHPQHINSPSSSPFMNALTLDSPLQSPCSPIASFNQLLLPPPPTRSRSRSVSSTCSSVSSFLNDLPPPLLYQEEQQEQAPSNPFTATTPKRKRGRPPNTSKPTAHHQIIQQQQPNSWTFVTPTVWDVHHQNIIHQQAEATDQQTQQDIMGLQHWPNNNNGNDDNNKKQQDEQGQNTFTNTNMDTPLSMPKKKRGRKPKKQMAGNFCFVWRDLTAPRATKAGTYVNHGGGAGVKKKARNIMK